MVALSHPTGNVNVRHAALALAEADLLGEFWTCLNWNSDSPVARLLPASWRGRLDRRSFPAAVRVRARTDPWLEAARLSSTKLGLPLLARHERGMFSVDAVYGHLDRRLARRLKGERIGPLRRSTVTRTDRPPRSTPRARAGCAASTIYRSAIGASRSASIAKRPNASRNGRQQWKVCSTAT